MAFLGSRGGEEEHGLVNRFNCSHALIPPTAPRIPSLSAALRTLQCSAAAVKILRVLSARSCVS